MEPILKFNKTKIVATVGPACNTFEKLKELVLAGADVFRLNFSHGSHEDHKKVITHIRRINDELGTHITILQDLQGPKIRTGEVENGELEVVSGQELIISTEDIVGSGNRISTSYTQLITDVSVGDMILIDDGKIELLVERSDGKEVKTRVVHGGMIKSRKGINLPVTNVSVPSLTDKDEVDLEFGIGLDVDWIALSFVRTASDIIQLKRKIEQSGKQIRVIAKIEKPEALNNIDEIIQATDGIMVARGDLGVEIAMEDVPLKQKMIVEKCKRHAKPVIIATQMMESMIENPRPTRAETNDVANAVLDGADALMLSAETAAGKFPIQTVRSMVKTITSIENQADIYYKFYQLDPNNELYINESLIASASKLSKHIDAKALIGLSQSGYTALMLARHRPKSHIFTFTNDKKLLTILNLVWGVRLFYYDSATSTNETLTELEDTLKKSKMMAKGDVYIFTANLPLHLDGRTNMMKVAVCD